MTRTYNYENDDFDFSYENSGASHEESEHSEDCDWIYDNCTCGLADKTQNEIYFDLREGTE